jgi:hypothetical protein
MNDVEKEQEHRQRMIDHLKKRQQLLLAISELLHRLDRYQNTHRHSPVLLLEATAMLHRIVKEVIGEG